MEENHLMKNIQNGEWNDRIKAPSKQLDKDGKEEE